MVKTAALSDSATRGITSPVSEKAEERLAVLSERGLSYSRHSAVRASMHRDFVKAGLLSSDTGMIYNRLFEWRQKADYEVLLKVDEGMARDLLKQTEILLADLKKLISR